MPSRPCSPRRAVGVLTDVMAALGRSDVDFVWLSETSWLLGWEVARGTLLAETIPGAYATWRRFAWQRYADRRLWEERDRRYFTRFEEDDWALNVPVIQRKLNAVARYLMELESSLPATEEAYLQDPYRTDRLFQLLVDAAVGINGEVAESVGKIPPSDYYTSFFALLQCGWIDHDTAGALAPLAGVRNRLVHQYEELDPSLVYEMIQAALPRWHTYLSTVRARLDQYPVSSA